MSHAFYIYSAYGVSALVFAGLILWLMIDGRARRREFEALEKAGAARRSARSRS